MIIRLPIDIKSLYLNIKNDNESGHTATVATPLKQYGGVNQELIEILKIPENINKTSRENLIGQLMLKSRAEAKINNVFVFDKICVNGISVPTVSQFCIYIREEIEIGYVHNGRQKVHYPMSLKYSDGDINIDNKNVIKSISQVLNNFAFVVSAFEFNTDNGVLNFDAMIVGESQIPYSKVFINKRGVGDKFTSSFTEEQGIYDLEIIALREKLGYTNVSPENFSVILDQNKKIADEVITNLLKKPEVSNVRNLSSEYPYALYDYEFVVNNVKKYLIVKFTSTQTRYFNLSSEKIQFCNNFSEYVSICLITDVNGRKELKIYNIDQINNLNVHVVNMNSL